MGKTLELWNMIASLKPRRRALVAPPRNSQFLRPEARDTSALGSVPGDPPVILPSYRRRLGAFSVYLLLLTAAPLLVRADSAAPSQDADQNDEDAAETIMASPRAALARFFELSRRGDHEGAGKF